MDVPNIPASDVGDLGDEPPLPPSVHHDVLPQRSISPPLPPRKNEQGLPPTYLAHLRNLLHQWLEQQVQPGDTGSPGPSTGGRERLWNDQRLRQIEDALWQGAVVRSNDSDGKQRLLDLDYNTWATGSAKRKAHWRAEQRDLEVTRAKELKANNLANKKQPDSEDAASRGRLSAPPSAIPMMTTSSSASTPQRIPTRPPSVASSDRRTRYDGEDGRTTPLGASPCGLGINLPSDDEKQRVYYEVLAGLKGFKRLSSSKRDEWEVIDDDLPVSGLADRELPGAFPQNGHAGHHPREPSAPSQNPFSLPWVPESGDQVKPLFCLHYTAPASHPSSSTVHLRRGSTVSAGSNEMGSTGSASGRWWSATGSARRWSGISIAGPRYPDEQEPVEVEFIIGRFALPSVAAIPSSPKRKGSLRRKKPVMAVSSSDTGDDHDDSKNSADDEGDQSSSGWSDTQRAGSRVNPSGSLSMVIGGVDDDLPRQSIEEGTIGVVGGTIVIRGTRSEMERLALQKILQNLIYTIQAMSVELELMDSFRVPRESDPLPLPPKQLIPRLHSTPPPSRPSSPGLKRNSSMKERGDKAKGFFQRLGKDTKGMFEGFMGKSRHDSSSGSRIREAPVSTPISQQLGAGWSNPPTTPSSASADIGTPPIRQATDRHLVTLERLEKILPSTTPGLRLPMPPLLLRAREENKIRKEKANQELAEDGGLDGVVDSSGLGASREEHLRGRARGYRTGGDIRAGLCVLMSGMDDFEGWNKLQRLETLACRGVEEDGLAIVCVRPQSISYVFWGSNDQTVGEFIGGLGERDSPCGRTGCDATDEEHIAWWFHSGKKVAMKVKKVEEGMGEIGLASWVRCEKCHRNSQPRPLGDVPSCYSWAKFLELLLYANTLCPPDFCSHPEDSNHVVTHYIRTPHLVVSLSVTSVSVLDTRLPKLQVGPNVSKRKAGKSGVAGTVESLSGKAEKEKNSVSLENDIQTVLDELERRIEKLRESLGPPTPPPKEKEENGTTQEVNLQSERVASLATISAELHESHISIDSRLIECPPGQLNDLRRQLAQSSQRIQDRLDEYEKKFNGGKLDPPITTNLPDYIYEKKIYTPPGSSVLVREDEPSSVIAYTLSCMAYFTELTTTGKVSNDPKAEEAGNDDWRIEVARKDTPRDLLSLRAITKKKSEISIAGGSHRLPLSLPPNQPSLELSLEQVEGKSQGTSDRLGDLVRNISKATAQDPILTTKVRSPSMSESDVSTTSTPVSRFAPMTRRISDSIKAPPSAFRPTRSVSSTVPSTPVLPSTSTPGSLSGTVTPQSVTPIHDATRHSTNDPKEGWSSVTSTFTNSLNSLMRIGSEVGSFRVKGTDRSLSSLIGPLAMMSSIDNSLVSPNMDDRPHIQFSFTLPDRVKFSCTVYYATAFDSLRRRCAIDKSIIESLSRCDIWDAQGGKSKASFFMTRDKKYIVKELVSKWNVSDTQALLEIAPSYFEHLAGTHNRATSLAKIVGFYSVKIQDLQTSAKKAMDLLVMENLFYKQNISQTYDLKGIEGRKVPKTTGDGSTMFDSEWIEGQSRTPILLHPHSKRILQEAISNDTRFLCSQSIMDYSLLLGLDESRKELVVGLVDAIGSYNLFKTIESRGKLALTRGGEVTIIPPDQYRERFENALKQYFIACPDKWSKVSRRSFPLDDTSRSVF